MTHFLWFQELQTMPQIEILYNLLEKPVDIQEILLGHQTIQDTLSLPVYEFHNFGR